MTNKKIIAELKQMQKDRPNVGADLTLFDLINLLIAHFEGKGKLQLIANQP
jgi:hypothetical protein